MFKLFFSSVILDFDNQTQGNNPKYTHTKASCTNIQYTCCCIIVRERLETICMINPKGMVN